MHPWRAGVLAAPSREQGVLRNVQCTSIASNYLAVKTFAKAKTTIYLSY